MILISHRGNIEGKNFSNENKPEYIDNALKKYDVEIDVWYINNDFYLGHDEPLYKIDINYLNKRKQKLWIHCKNIEALIKLNKNYHCFFHEDEDVILTSKNYIIAHVNYGILKSSIIMLPEAHNYKFENIKECIGICSDKIKEYNQNE